MRNALLEGDGPTGAGVWGSLSRWAVLVFAVAVVWPGWLAGAGQSSESGGLALLAPADGSVVYATTYGGKPVLAWRDESGRPAGQRWYQVWMDGRPVEQFPAGRFGHLPGKPVGNYEPYRPYGLLGPTNICYYTPPLSRLKPGVHRWHVVVVDREGRAGRTSGEFGFTVEAWPAVKVFVNHAGYLAGQGKTVVVDGQVAGSDFEVVDARGRVVFRGKLEPAGQALGDYRVGDFSGLEAEGTYRVRVGSESSPWFPIGLGARLNYETYLRKYRQAYTRKRCGPTKANWGRRPCHLEDARMEGGRRRPVTGGWHASSDVRKIMRILQPGLAGLVALKEQVNPPWDRDGQSILEEIRWANRYLHAMQLDSGEVVQHYYLWCGAEDWGESLNRYTNNVIGDADDRLLPEKTLVIDMVTQSRFIENQTAIYRLYRRQDPAYADRCLQAARRCYQAFVRRWPDVTAYETTFCARPYMEPASDLMPLAYGIRAHLSMYLATGQPQYRDRAVELADRLLALQESRYIAGQSRVRGFFYNDATRQEIFTSLMAHGGMDGVEGAVMALADLCQALPDHPRCARWKQSLRSYLEDALLVLAGDNAFGLVPSYLSLHDKAGGQTGAAMPHHVGGLHYQYLCDNRGINKTLARKALLLARGASILDRPPLRRAAWRQVDWILGCNPLNTSTAYGIGHGQPPAYKPQLAPRSDGMLVQGIGGRAGDRPYLRPGHWRHCEMELHITAWFARTLFQLLPTTPPTGPATPSPCSPR